MKRRIFQLFSYCFILFLFSACLFNTEKTVVAVNPNISDSRAASLDFIFDNNKMGKTTIIIKRSEWNKLCDDYRYFYKNENCVRAESYVFEKGGKKWAFNKGVGFRLRGNTSRFCPQGYDNGNLQGQMNASWSTAYYAYANQPNNDYRQSHFKVDFEEFLEDGEEQKMAGCMKGVALKRMDNWCGKEIFCYDLFHKYGIWTAPRASHTRVIIKIVEDNKRNSVTTIDYGVYEMFEEVNKQSLKARDKDENSDSNAWKNSKGNLWKCSNDLTLNRMHETGIEDIRIVYKGETEPDNMKTNGREDRNRIGYVWKSYSLDLKTNKDNFVQAESELQGFIKELNGLPVIYDDNDTDSINTVKDFYEKWFDVDFFLKTYAINILCGMDDDYWGNANNYYLYFDTGSEKSTGKVYLIPFDYDNTLGASIKDGGFMHNPLDWGRGADRPLMDRLLSVPEYKAKFIEYLKEVSSQDSFWNFDRCSSIFLEWGARCTPYMQGADLDYHIGASEFNDWGSWGPPGYFLTHSPNVFDETRNYFNYWLSDIPISNILSEKTDSDKQGLYLSIKKDEIPSEAAIRKFYINGKLVADAGFSTDSQTGKITIDTHVFDTEWLYPYVVAGKVYKVKVEYQNTNYSTIYTSPEISITAKSGIGELHLANNPSYKIENNVLLFNPEPDIRIGDEKVFSRWDWDKYYIMEITTTDWNYQSWNWLNDSCSSFDFSAKNVVKDRNSELMFYLYYVISNDIYGNYRLGIYDYDETLFYYEE